MSKERVLPRYLSKLHGAMAIEVALQATMHQNSPIKPYLKRLHCHIVILVPALQRQQDKRKLELPDLLLSAEILHERSVGEEEWEHPYQEIARAKAFQLFQDRNDGEAGVIPHLLFSGDTPYWGAVKREGIIVACSGVQPWFDRLISSIVADTLIALAHAAYENDDERKSGVDFLS